MVLHFCERPQELMQNSPLLKFHFFNSSIFLPVNRIMFYLINMIFYDNITTSVDKGEAADVVYLDFSKLFNTDSHTVLSEKMAAHGLYTSV